MASIKLGMAFADIRGTLGGNYFAKRKNTIIVARCGSKLTKADSGRTALQQSRNNLSAVSRAWKTIGADKQLQWNNEAALLTWYTKVRIPYTPSGYQLFSQNNSNMLKVGSAIILEPNVTVGVGDPNLISITISPLHVITYEYLGRLGSTEKVVISGSYPNSLGVKHPKGGYKTFLVTYAGDNGPLDITAAYLSVFGVTPIAGMVFFKAEIIDSSSGVSNGSKLTKADSGRI